MPASILVVSNPPDKTTDKTQKASESTGSSMLNMSDMLVDKLLRYYLSDYYGRLWGIVVRALNL